MLYNNNAVYSLLAVECNLVLIGAVRISVNFLYLRMIYTFTGKLGMLIRIFPVNGARFLATSLFTFRKNAAYLYLVTLFDQRKLCPTRDIQFGTVLSTPAGSVVRNTFNAKL